MNTLPSFSRTCARRAAIFTSKPTTTASTLSSSTRPRLQPQSTPSPRLLSTSTSTSTSASTTNPSPPSTTSSVPSPTPLSTTSPFLLTGTVTRAGTMKNCIQITQQAQVYDRHLQKHYVRPSRMLIHDPNPAGFLSEGDVVEFGLFSAAERAARLERKAVWDAELAGGKSKRRGAAKAERTKWRGPKMVVRRVVTAFGTGVEARMERVAEVAARGEGAVPAARKGRVGKQHAGARVAG